MKKRNYIILCLLLMSCLYSQNKGVKADDFGRIAIAPVVGEIPDMPASAEKMLLNKMNQIMTRHGMASFANRFIMFPNVTILSQDITPTAPPMHAYNLEITLSIGDNETQTVYNSVSIETKGVGKNPTKAYIQALKMLNAKNPDVKDFIETGKNKIIEYYNSKCDFILKEAQTLAGKKEFEKAIYKAISVPEICKDCFDRAQDLSVVIYKQKMEQECQEGLSQAKVAIAQDNYDLAASHLSKFTPDLKCYSAVSSLLKEIENHRCALALGKAKGAWAKMNAVEASKHLGSISADSNCADEAESLNNAIRKKLKADADKQWALDYEKYDRDQKLTEQQHQHGVDMDHRNMDYKEQQGFELKKASIEATKAVGVAYGKNQQPTNINWISGRY